MEGIVEVVSREIIKPSSQTPPHLKKLKLSYIDKLLTYTYIPLIFFYEANESTGLITSNHRRISERLKKSLSDTLPSFYPLAGRLRDHLFIDCNDSGVEFVDARVRGHLKDYVHMDDQLKQFLPSYCTGFEHVERPRPMLVVQITFFDCGGLVVGVSISHSMADLESTMSFLGAWAASFRGEVATARHTFGNTAVFPTLGPIKLVSVQRIVLSNENFKTKRYVFDKEKMNILRKAITSSSESDIKNPSRVELISSFIWKHFMAARLKNQKGKKRFAAVHAVNLRPRTTPSNLFENVFGNCIMSAFSLTTCEGRADELSPHELIDTMRRAIGRIRDSYITRPVCFMKDLGMIAISSMMGRLEFCYFTSWRGFPFYELDFGWGKPTWFSTPAMPAKNQVILVSGKSGDDVEAIATMMPEDLEILDAQINLISTNV